MPAAYSQNSAALRADRQAKAGYTSVGRDPQDYVGINGRVRRRRMLGDPLPMLAPGGLEWAPEVRDWYADFRRSPQASLLVTDVDWQMLLIAAELLNIFYASGSLQAYSRFEALVSKFGTTPADRRKLRLSVEVPDPVDQDSGETADTDDFDQEFALLTDGLFE